MTVFARSRTLMTVCELNTCKSLVVVVGVVDRVESVRQR